MDNFDIYKRIAERTQGDIYLGIVGPVRTGKSTFIKKFMELMVIPNIDSPWQKERARDELPQSATGRTVMTTEPKFVPNEAVDIVIDSNVNMKVRLVDCVGYMVDGALGSMEEDVPRMVSTPWMDKQIPFEEAAELGTKKVIHDHSTIGLVVTTDGSITDIPRDAYLDAEERVIRELNAINKPFVILLNSTNPNASAAQKLKSQMEDQYKMPVLPVNCLELTNADIDRIFEKVLYEFPISEICFNMPSWMDALDGDHWLKSNIINSVKESFKKVKKFSNTESAIGKLKENQNLEKVMTPQINLGDGTMKVELTTPAKMLFQIIGENTGFDVNNERELFTLLKSLSTVKKEYDRIEYALHEVKTKGYGIVNPHLDELTLEEPVLIKQGGKYGVKLRATAPSIHMIRCDVETEIAPLVGTEKQSEDLVNRLLSEYENDTQKIWDSNIFGKTLHELVSEGLNNKLFRMPEDSQEKLRETLQMIINEGSGGLICIIL